MTDTQLHVDAVDVDELAQEIRRVDGAHDLGAAALAEALAPYIAQQIAMHVAAAREALAEDDTPAPAGAMKPIPIRAAREVAERYGYDQVIVIARRVGEAPDPYGEHVTTYGRTREHCRVAAGTGDFLKHKIMGWPRDDGGPANETPDAFLDRIGDALLSRNDLRDSGLAARCAETLQGHAIVLRAVQSKEQAS